MKTVIASLVLALFAACSPYSPDLGAAPFICGTSDPLCPDGYDCVAGGSGGQMICVAAGGTVPDASSGQCADDSNLEPNNMVSNAYVVPNPLPVMNNVKTITYAGLAICPAGDKDTYAVMASASSQTLQADIEFDPNQAALVVNIISSAGATVVMGQPNGTGKSKVALANVPVGGTATYVQVQAAQSSGSVLTNNYKLTLTLTP